MSDRHTPKRYFSTLLPELATRAARATISRLGFSNATLRRHLAATFAAPAGLPGSFVGEPVFEATFGWETAEPTLAELAPELLRPSVVDALDRPGGAAGKAYRLARDSRPYRHQLAAWHLLRAETPQSVVVTSGTGSGKTECFMVPILDDLARETEKSTGAIEGVRALFLYPLNALIQSQQERLDAWTNPFGGKIRFCLYNGLTPEKPEPAHARRAVPNQVRDRETLRAAPPPILVTNATMLEYMLVRAQDAPILAKSRGMLRWVVLDEAHSYIGSQAAELALLLRRVLHGFGVAPEQVRFVATSATIGDPDGEAGSKLRQFLAGLAGVPTDRVHLVAGRRMVPSLPAAPMENACVGLEALEAIDDPGALFDATLGSTTARRIRSLFVPGEGGRAAVTLSRVVEVVGPGKGPDDASAREVAMRWLDVATRAIRKDERDGRPFLPLRVHAFHNVLYGVWACSDSACRLRSGTALDQPDWHYGAIYFAQRDACDCGAPVYELRSCNDCNETFLWAKRALRRTDMTYRLLSSLDETVDEFQLELEAEGGTDASVTEAILDGQDIADGDVLIANGHPTGTAEVHVEFDTFIMDAPNAERSVKLRVREADEGILRCPGCGGQHGAGQLMFRPARLGAPFMLGQVIPTLLDFCPDGDSPSDRPMRGRRMITFTDSRQGTARIAARLQQDAERNCVRALVYQRLATSRNASPAQTNDLDDQIAALQALSSRPAALQRMLDDLLAQRAAADAPTTINFGEMASLLATHEADINRWALDHYKSVDPAQFDGASGGLELAKLFLAREFSRRPKRANSLETMGLVAVQYPKLENVKALPAQVAQHANFTVAEWKQFLKIALDFVVRENTFVDIGEAWRRWIGNRFSRKQLLPPDSHEPQTSTLRRWPQCNPAGVQGRLVRLLAIVCAKDPTTAGGRDAIDSILRAAYDDLVRVDLLRKSSVGRYLSLEDISFSLTRKAWICPVTRRLLDVTLRDLTPYLPLQSKSESTIRCVPVAIPLWPRIADDYRSDTDRLEAARGWLGSDVQVGELRAQGVWPDLNDRIVEGRRYFRAAEHSAQQPGTRLQQYEASFKDGRINLLSCSTTMEMGVDIGGISVMAMNNVPPHPANYLQRAGRAGRRGETRSVAVTVCKSNPHDQMVLANPLWAFITALPAPTIKLESPVIVQRHLNALLLSAFLWRRAQGSEGLHRLTMEWWALSAAGVCHGDEFCAAARCFEETADPSLTEGMRRLIRHTCFEGSVPLERLARNAADAMEGLLAAWRAEVDAIDAQLAMFGAAGDSTPAGKALRIQRKRLTDEYLLSELVRGGFLPGYGFPTDITPFDTLNVEAIKRIERQRSDARGREDNRMRSRDLPSRDTVTALREYAPGADVVIDGTVYRSAGITLNWHAPASVDNVKQIQSIREAWRCVSCGAAGTSVTASRLDDCPSCGNKLVGGEEREGAATRFTYIEPAGFAVDLYVDTHNDVETQSFVPVEPAWINAEGDWLPLPNPTLGSYRISSNGTVFSHSSGLYRNGYAICLECGRAEPMPAAGDANGDGEAAYLPAAFRQPHRRLRGAPKGEQTMCKGSAGGYSVKPYMRLGHEAVTDVLELQLNDQEGLPISDDTVAYSMAVALRDALAAMVGVESGEIGCDTKPIRHPVAGVSRSIVLYDLHAAGLCSSVADRLAQLLASAVKSLSCDAGCHKACQRCLLSYDTRFRLPSLDRHAALSVFTQDWLQRLRLEAEDALFGEDRSVAESQVLHEAVTREWARPDASELRIYFSGEPQNWDLAGSPLKRHLLRWAYRGPVRLVLPQGSAARLSAAARFDLAVVSRWEGVTVHEMQPGTGTEGGLLAEIVTQGKAVLFGSRAPNCGTPAEVWGRALDRVLVRGTRDIAQNLSPALDLPYSMPAEVGHRAARIAIGSEIDGQADGLGSRLLSVIQQGLKGRLLEGSDDICAIVYRDRYLNAPLPVMLLVAFVNALKSTFEDRWAHPTLEIVTAEVPEETRAFGRPTQVFHNWTSTRDRDAAVRAAFDYCGIGTIVRSMPRAAAAHARTLEVTTASGGKLRIWFDQGFGYWTLRRAAAGGPRSYFSQFPFGSSVEQQAEAIAQGRCQVEGQAFETQIFVEA